MSMPFASSMPVRPTVSKCSTAHPISGNGCFKNDQEPQATRKTASHVLAWPRDQGRGFMSSPVVLITGALTGIGRAAAIIFALEKAHIVVSGRRDKQGQKLVA